jgi:hypothetical protein
MRIKLEDSCVNVVVVNETFLRDSVSSQYVAIKNNKVVRNYWMVRGGPGVGGGGVGLYIKSGLGFKVIARSSESGVEFLFVEVKLRNRVVLVATIYRPPNTSVVYRSTVIMVRRLWRRFARTYCQNMGKFVFLDILMLFCWIAVILCFPRRK